MSFFEEMLRADAAVFTNSAEFGESITYTPLGGAARTVNAMVHRFPPADGEAGKGHRMLVTVANDATTGISAAELNPGGDRITVAYRVGGTARAYHVSLSTDAGEWHDAGCVTLELR